MSRCRYHLLGTGGLALTGLHIVQNREGIATVSSTTVPEFGPNDWFVEEKYNQFLVDPSSVEQIWRDFFTDPVDEARRAPAHGSSHGKQAGPAQKPAAAAPSAPAAPGNTQAPAASTPPPPPPP